MAQRKKLKNKAWRKIRHFGSRILIGITVIFALFLLLSRFSPAGLKVLDVKTGSMSPTIKTGSLIFSWPAKTYKVSDIIVFHWGNTRELVTHRIVGVNPNNQNYFQTKGDANQIPDMGLVSSGQIIGKIFLTFPFLGFAISFIQTLPGLIIFIVLPSLMIISEEISNIIKELKKQKKPKKAKRIILKQRISKKIIPLNN
ncbi:MAG: signal peptidase I [Patescibacteria group bacterium]